MVNSAVKQNGFFFRFQNCLTDTGRDLQSESDTQGCDLEAQFFKVGVPYALASFDGIACVQ